MVCFTKVGSGRAALTTALCTSLRPFSVASHGAQAVCQAMAVWQATGPRQCSHISTGQCGKPRLRLVRCDWDDAASGGPWELWLLPLFGLSYSARDVAAGIFTPDLLVFRAQVVPVVAIFGYPIGDPFSMFLSVFQVIDLLAQSHLPWLLGL